METNDYEFLFEIDDPLGNPNDAVFVKRGFMKELENIEDTKRYEVDKTMHSHHESKFTHYTLYVYNS